MINLSFAAGLADCSFSAATWCCVAHLRHCPHGWRDNPPLAINSTLLFLPFRVWVIHECNGADQLQGPGSDFPQATSPLIAGATPMTAGVILPQSKFPGLRPLHYARSGGNPVRRNSENPPLRFRSPPSPGSGSELAGIPPLPYAHTYPCNAPPVGCQVPEATPHRSAYTDQHTLGLGGLVASSNFR